MDASEVKQLLNDRAAECCAYLFPAGKQQGPEFKIGNLAGEAGESLVVGTLGSKVGVWKDFATGEAGSNLLELWLKRHGLEFKEAIREAKDWLGVADTLPRRMATPAKKVDTTKLKSLSYAEVVEGSPVWNWLTKTRGLSEGVIRLYRLGEGRFPLSKQGPDPINWVVFPFFDAQGNLVRLKYRDIVAKKNMFQKPSMRDAEEYAFGAPKLLFGQQAVADTAGMIGLTEGELDAMALTQGGALTGVSLPEGAQAVQEGRDSPHDAWLEHDHDWLERFTDIVLALDGDEPGQKAKNQLLPRLGYARCKEVLWPEGVKDANEALCAGVPLDRLVCEARDFTPSELKKPSEFAQDIWWEFYPEESDRPKGDPLPWNLPFAFRPGEFIVWHGYNGHGKTMMQNQCMVDFAYHGKKICVASLEIPARKTFRNMARQAMAKNKPEHARQVQKVLAWFDQYFIVYDKVGETDSRQLLEAFEYAYRKWGIQHFVVDSLMMLSDVGLEDYAGQLEVCKLFKAFAHRHNVTIHMVCHSKKPTMNRPAEKKEPLKYDISGTSGIPNIADSVISVWRNQEKEQKLAEARSLRVRGEFDQADKMEKPFLHVGDAKIQIQKQRETGEEPGKYLYFDPETFQFMNKESDQPKVYVDVSEQNK